MIFLRPFFLLLLLVPFVLWFRYQKAGYKTQWRKWIDPALLPWLLSHTTNKHQYRMPIRLLTLIWCLWSIALAGPAIQTSVSTYLNNAGTVIVLDLNSTAQNDQLIKMRTKLTDLLALLSDEATALVLYDEKGYTLTPLTHDKNILRNLIPTLSAGLLPSAQNKPETGFIAAEKLFQNLNLNTGRIFLITGGGFDARNLAERIQQSPYQTAVLWMPVDADQTPPDLSPAVIHPRTADETDIRSLITATPIRDNSPSEQVHQTTAYRDMGLWLVLASLPFVLYLFRKNVLFLILLMFCPMAQADFFHRPDQQAYAQAQQAVQAFEQNAYQQAHDLFITAPALYETPADALYNAATALAFTGQIDQAIALYERTLAQNPNHADALFNKEYLEKQLQSQQNNSTAGTGQSDSNSNTDNTSNESQQSDNSDEQSDKPDESTSDTSDEQDTADTTTKPDDKPTDDESNNDTSDTEQQNADTQQSESTQQSTQPATDSGEPQSEQTQPQMDQGKQQLFNRIQEDPARLLRNRIYQQYRRQR